MKQINKWCRLHAGIVGLILLWVLLCSRNLLPKQTWLLGYDNLLPELNLPLWWERNFYSIWQDYRGLGVANSVAEGSELTRLPWVWLVATLCSPALVRWSWVAAMLLLGTLATYYLARDWLTLALCHAQNKLPPAITNLAATVAGIFYLLSPATVQLCYTPLESFTSWHGWLPVILYCLLRFVRTANAKNLLLLTIVSVLASSAFHLETLFIVLFFAMIVMGAGLLTCKYRHFYLQRLLLGIVSVIVANSWWLLPMAWTTMTAGNDFTLSKQNQITTPQVQEMNYSRGNLANVALLHGYWFDYREYNPTDNSYSPYLGVWESWWQQPSNQVIGYSLFILAGSGLLLTIYLAQRKAFALAQLGLFLLGIFMLTAGNGLILGLVFRCLTKLPLLADIFRVAFTKWSSIANLGLSLGLANAVVTSYLLFYHRIRHHWVITTTLALAVAVSIVYRAYPAFNGELFGWQVKTAIPERYFKLQEFMHHQNHAGTTIYLPHPNYWGWLFYDWGYRGSGFLWQMIPQPLLDRNFDAWSLYNQTAYQQFNLAMQKQNAAEIEQLMAKYQLQYAIIDGSLMNAGDNQTSKRQEEVEELQKLWQQAGAQLLWQQENLSVWQLSPHSSSSYPVSLSNNYQLLAKDAPQSLSDPLFTAAGDYLADSTNPQASWYPFADNNSEKLSQINCTGDECQLKVLVPPPALAKQQLLLPAWQRGELITINGSAWLDSHQQLQLNFYPQITLQAGERTLSLPQLPQLHLDLAKLALDGEGAIVDFGDQLPHQITPGKLVDFTTQLKVGQDLQIKSFPAHLASASAAGMQIAANQVVNFTYPENIWEEFFQEKSLPLNGESLQATWHTPVYSLNLASEHGQSCDVSARGQASKKITSTGNYYQTSGYGSWCESYYLSGIAAVNDYVLLAAATNITGQPLRFRVVAENQRQTLLTHKLAFQPQRNPSLQEQYFYLSASENQDSGQKKLFFYLTAQSYGQPSNNYLTQISLLLYPFEQLKRLKTVPSNAASITGGNAPTITNYQNHHHYFYQFQLLGEATPTQPTAVVLWRAFNSSWRATYRLPGGKWQNLPHYRYNSWANAWLLPSSTHAQQVEIRLLYFPQKLVTLGLWLLLGQILCLLYWQYHPQQKTSPPPRRYFH